MTRSALTALLAAVVIATAADGMASARSGTEAPSSALAVFRLEGDRTTGSPSFDEPLPVGSLVKPFVAEAWARSHPGLPAPRFRCEATSGCWIHSGHGPLGLRRAVSLSCNTYFRALAAATPERVLSAVLREEGFLVPSPLLADAAIGLDRDGAVAARPKGLLEAYVRLTREPWREGEAVRSEVLAGLRDNATSGTARGLGRYGLWAKTGTIPGLDGRPLGTSGLALVVDDAGSAVLGLLREGTGREAARALATRIEDRSDSPGSHDGRAAGPSPAGAQDRLSVALFGTLRLKALVARNAGTHPLLTSRGFLGPGASVSLRAGDTLSEGRFVLTVPGTRFRRELRASLACAADDRGVLRVRAEMALPEYVLGVLNAELPGERGARRDALAAAILRFLADGPRHGANWVCDSTHCAWFVGRGPTISWPSPDVPVLFASRPSGDRDDGLLGASWDAVVRLAREPGPRQWTSDCGGRPLSAHALWGNGDRRVFGCDRHREPAPRWSRLWNDTAVKDAFGSGVRSLRVAERDGTWTLLAETAAGLSAFSYDEAHRRLAATLGWAALPSPADAVTRTSGGFRAEGVGLGHRVGLCLAEERR